MTYHVYPHNDLKEHNTESDDFGRQFYCECNPSREEINGVLLVIHNSFDGREAVEWANEVLKAKEQLGGIGK